MLIRSPTKVSQLQRIAPTKAGCSKIPAEQPGSFALRVGAPIVSVTANALPDGARYNRDNVVAMLAFQDGSIASVSYLAKGDRSIPKEQFEVFCEGKVGLIDDFCTLELARDGKTRRTKARRDKGHAHEIELTLEAIRRGASSPIPFEELIEVSEATIAVEEAIATGDSVSLRSPYASAG